MKLEHKEFIELFSKGNPVYFINTFEDTVIKYDGGDSYLAKQRGKTPYQIEHSTILVTDALLESNQISEEEFYKF
jgi:hypothetical protein